MGFKGVYITQTCFRDVLGKPRVSRISILKVCFVVSDNVFFLDILQLFKSRLNIFLTKNERLVCRKISSKNFENLSTTEKKLWSKTFLKRDFLYKNLMEGR